ncbi:MAG: M15 family metallopeptidase [Ruminococcus sp.]|uniref:M15 family metallopeptidase n=1 Tax=Ruminococcus sp. TaxID=41978 RepID=UPI0025E095F7|nr:M15 family metallopeptidase [Ruminococcus sp.]MBR3666834.1 M15 family metallopeptidase [Ruminococcus sp.]MBR6996291.1 M15 family metallopeptidase [Ruminococcus sp.]
MKRNISIAAAALTAVLSFTACGRVTGTNEEVSALPVVTTNTASTEAASTTTAAPSAVTATTSAAEGSSEETTTAAAPDAANTEATTAASVAAGGGDQSSNSGSAGSSNSGSGSGSTQQSAPASRDHAPSPEDYNYGPAPTQYSNDGLTYIQGVLIANKSYSLPADFNPGLDPTCQNQFYKLQSDAAAQGLNIWLSSGFRSYDYQNQIYNNYVARDGQAAADTYSARPGHSEHQSGLAIDVNQIDDSFIGTPEAIWLENHCHEYGFILRYPQGKQDITGYKYESWHIRYVGTDMSYPIHDSGLTLEEYFGIDSYYH